MMPRQLKKQYDTLLLIPLFAILLFFILYIIAASLYPGGSNFDVKSSGFNLLTNYWCELLGATAKNGRNNPGRNFAISAMVILTIGLSFFWYYFPWLYNTTGRKAVLLRTCGIMSMFTILFLLTKFHDEVINIAGGLGLIALFIVYHELYKNRSFMLFNIGMFCFFLILLNNYIYISGSLINYLPVVQKISFFVFLSWIALMDIALYKKNHRITRSNQRLQ